MESVSLFVSESVSVVLLADEQGYRKYEFRPSAQSSDASPGDRDETLRRLGSLAEVFAAEIERLLPVDGSPEPAPTVEPLRRHAESFARGLARAIGRAA